MTRISDWLRAKAGQPGSMDVEDTAQSFRYLLAALRSRAPGQWSQNVLELSRHFTSAVYLAINTLATQAAHAEVKLWERAYDSEDGDFELDEREPAFQLFLNPNNDDCLSDLLYQITQQLSLTGIALVWMPQLGKLPVPSELYVLPSASALPWPPSPIYPQGSYLIQPYYPYGPFTTIPSYQSAAGARIPAEQVLRIKNHHPYLHYDGYAVLTALNRQIDTIDAIDQARLTTQQKGVDPTVSLEFDPAVLDPSQTDMTRLREQLEALYSGPLGKKVWLNPVGSKMTRLSQTPAEMAWTEGWSQLVDMALAAYGTPKAVAGLQNDVNYATLYSSLKQFHVNSLNPLLRKIAERKTKHVLRPFFGEDLYMTLEAQKITDEELLEKQLGTDIQAGNVRKVNEYRKLRGLKPLEGEEGEAFVGKAGQQQPAVTQQRPGDPDRPDADLDAVRGTRPDNGQGEDSLPPRIARKALQGDGLATLLERAKTNGTAYVPPTALNLRFE